MSSSTIGAATERQRLRIRLPFPHSGQQAVLGQQRRFNWLAAGRRWRKTTLCMAVAVQEAARGKAILWGAPTFDQVRVCWDEARRATGTVGTFHKAEMVLSLPSGGRIIFRSLDDPDHARGHTADGVIIDEAADVAEAAWYEVLRPTLMSTGGWAWIIGTPKGRNWFWREFAMASERPDSVAWQAPTLGAELVPGGARRVPHPLENPEIPFTEIVHLAKTLPERSFRQEILAEFIEESGGVFRGVREVIDTGRVENEPPYPSKSYCLGVDLARVEDFTVLDVIDNGQRQVYHERFNQISWERQVSAIERVARLYGGSEGSALVFLDSTGVGDPIYEALRKKDLRIRPYTFSNASKEALIDNLAMAIEQERIALMDLPTQTNELLAFQYELTPSRNVRMGAPAGMHDDCVIALALAEWGWANRLEFDFS